MPRRAAAGRLHWRQMRALFHLNFRELSRSGIQLTSGAKGNQLKQLVLSLGVIGVLSTTALKRMEPAAFMNQIFAGAWLLVALMILPETLQAREHKREILASRPVSRRTHAVVQVLHLGMLALVVSFAYSIVPLGAVWLSTGVVGAPGFLALLAALAAGCFAVTALWLPISLRLGRRLGIERLRFVSQILLILFFFATAVPVLGSRGFLPANVARWVPSTWFADLARGTPAAWWQAAVVILLPVAAVVSGYRLNADVLYEEEGGRRYGAGGKGLARRLLDGCRQVPLLGRRWLPPPTHAVADLVLRVMSREEATRLRGLTGWLLAAVGAVTSVGDPVGAMLVVTALGVALGDGMIAAGQSSDPAASWLLEAAPVPARHHVAGVRWAVSSRFAAFPLLVLATLAFVYLPWSAALLLTLLGLPVVVYTVLSLALLVLPVPPLAEAPATRFLRGLLTMPLISFGLLLSLALLVALGLAGFIGLAIDAFLLLVIGGLGWLASKGAARRLLRHRLRP